MGYNRSEILLWCEHRGIAKWIETLSNEDLNNNLSRFVLEENRQDGASCPPDMLFKHLKSK